MDKLLKEEMKKLAIEKKLLKKELVAKAREAKLKG